MLNQYFKNFFISLKVKLIAYTLFFIITSTITMGLVTDNYIHGYFHKNIKVMLKEVFFDISTYFKNIEKDLTKSIHVASKNESLIASLNLIKNYEDRENYNEIIFNEEKKRIIDILIQDGEHFSQDHISIYDDKQNLIVFIDRELSSKIQGFVSYKNGKKLYYIKRIAYQEPYCLSSKPEHFLEKSKITSNIIPNKLENSRVLYRNFKDTLNLETKQAVLHKLPNNKSEIVGYINANNNIYVNELNKALHKEKFLINYYFSNSKNFKLKIQEYKNIPLLFSDFRSDELSLNDHDKYFDTAVKIPINNGKIILTAKTDKTESRMSLYNNRKSLLEGILIIIVITILLSLIILDRMVSIPIGRLIEGIEIIAKGEYLHRIDINQNDELGIISNRFNDMAEQISKREYALDALVQQDILTKIPNRTMFNERLEEAISRASRLNKKIAVFFIDLDEFKIINDTLGHDIGDKLLIEVASNLIKVMRKNDLLARIGGDEFNVLIEDLDSIVVAEEIAQKLIKQIVLPIKIKNNQLNITASIGVSIYPIDGKDSTTLLKNADLAMYDAKSDGKNSYKFFSEELSRSLKERALILKELKAALRKDEFELYYQPKFSLKDGSIYAAEALIRWKSKTLGFILPDDFIPLAEESGEIVKIGAWIIDQACKDFESWSKLGLNIKQVSVNVSNIQFAKDDVIKVIKNTLKKYNINASSLEVEITESYIHENSEDALKVLNQIRKLGVDLAMDDFGTGYSSMSYLKRLPLTRLKIDKSFIDDLPYSNNDVEITKVIVALAKVMNLSITAEGVETLEQMHFLQGLGCDEGQGYICSKPIPNYHFIKLIQNNTNCVHKSKKK